jgi:hypothetical protein
MGMEHRHAPKVTATPSEVQTGINGIEGKKQDEDSLVRVSGLPHPGQA